MDAANIVKARDELKDITECCICKDSFNDPRMLPCNHSFCLKCLEQTHSVSRKVDKRPMSCPVCRQEFTIKPDGLSGLQKNFFMERLVKLSTVFNPTTSHPCEACLENDVSQPEYAIAPAMIYCSDCRQKLCEDCCKLHRRNKVLKTHRLVTLENSTARFDISQFARNLCSTHEKNHLDSYCKDCNEVVCAWCFIEKHQTHSWSSVDNILDDFHKQVGQNLSNLSGCLTDILRKRQGLENDRRELLQTLQNFELTIFKTRDELKARLDKDTDFLLVEMSFVKQNLLKDIENASKCVEEQLVIFESFMRYCDEIKTKGTVSNICLSLGDLRRTADELSAMHDSIAQLQISPLSFSFQKSSFSEMLHSKDQLCVDTCRPMPDDRSRDSMTNEDVTPSAGESSEVLVSDQAMHLVGSQTITTNTHPTDTESSECTSYRQVPLLIKIIQTDMSEWRKKPIWGVAVLDGELFIITQRMSKIDVYSSDTFQFRRRIPASLDLVVLVHPRDIVACTGNRCLYVMDWKEIHMKKEIVRLDPTGSVIRRWLTGEDKGLLSVANDSNIILTVTNRNRLIEYSPDGQLVREVILSPISSSPWHAVKLTNGHFLVSQDDERLHSVCLVDSGGRTVRSFIKEGDKSLRGYVHLVVDRGGWVLLADTFKNRVMLLSPDLHYKTTLVSKGCGLRCPVRMQLEESSGRLFIVDNELDYSSRGKWTDGRILVFDVGGPGGGGNERPTTTIAR